MNATSSIPVIANIRKLQPGQAIKMFYSVTTAGAFGSLSLTVPSDASEITDNNLATPDGYFYFVCVGYENNGKLKLVADRVIQTNISWDTLSAANLCTVDGRTITLDNKKYANCSMRLPLSSSVTSINLDNEFEMNEWDAIINGNNVVNELTKDEENFWNTSIKTWGANTPIGAMSNRVVRGQDIESNVVTQSNQASTYTGADVGFRPILIVPDLMDKTPSLSDLTYPTCSLELVRVAAMAQPGQAVPCRYTVATANTCGDFTSLGTSSMDVIPDRPPTTPDGTFYFICVGYEPSGVLKFVADRVIQVGISWETLNTEGYCTYSGKDVSGLTGIDNSCMRLMSSSVVTNSQSHLSSEWDAIIYRDTVGSSDEPTSKINDWNYSKTKSWMLETPHITDDLGNPADMSYRVVRGQEDRNYGAVVKRSAASNFASEQIGFRPVLDIPINAQTILFTKEEVTPTRTSKYDITIDLDFMFLDEEATLETTTFEFYVGDTKIGKTMIPEDFHITKKISYDSLVAGENDLRVISICADKQKILAYKVYKEVPGDTTRTRNYPHYAGGFNIGTNLSISSNKVASDTSSVNFETATRVKLPKNLTAIRVLDT